MKPRGEKNSTDKNKTTENRNHVYPFKINFDGLLFLGRSKKILKDQAGFFGRETLKVEPSPKVLLHVIHPL